MATKKAGGSTSNLRDSISKRLGVKKFDGEVVKAGNIIIRQRGSNYRPGVGVLAGTDYTIFANIDGFVKFSRKKIKKFTGKLEYANFVSVNPTK